MPPARLRGDPGAVALGPGYLFYHPHNPVDGDYTGLYPEDLATDWEDADPAWVLLGYTVAGSEFNWALDTAEVEVAEELDPIQLTTTARTGTVAFAMAEMTASHLSVAVNGGVIRYAGMPTTPGVVEPTDPDIVIVEPPGLGAELRCMLGFDSEDRTERWIFKKCFQSGTMKVTREKGTTIAAMEVSFALEKPLDAGAPWIAIMDRALRGGWQVPASTVPLITGIAPANQAAAGQVVITGQRLAGATAPNILFGAAPATGIGAVTDTQIAAVVVPAGAAGAVPVTVTGTAGTSAAYNGFSRD
jgi:IPT/TIG domain